MGQKFCQNHPIPHRFQDKCVFAFYVQIQDGRQMWQENDFCEVASRLCRYPVGQKFHRYRPISHPYQDKGVFAFYEEIQDGRPKWWENLLLEKTPVDSADTLRVKNSIETALSRTVKTLAILYLITSKS